MSSEIPKLCAATSDEWAQLLAQSAGDWALSQTFEFGAAISRAYSEYSHAAQIAEFTDGARVLIPLVECAKSAVSRVRGDATFAQWNATGN